MGCLQRLSPMHSTSKVWPIDGSHGKGLTPQVANLRAAHVQAPTAATPSDTLSGISRKRCRKLGPSWNRPNPTDGRRHSADTPKAPAPAHVRRYSAFTVGRRAGSKHSNTPPTLHSQEGRFASFFLALGARAAQRCRKRSSLPGGSSRPCAGRCQGDGHRCPVDG